MTHATPKAGRLPLAALPALVLTLAACGHDVTATGPYDYLQAVETADDVAWPTGEPCPEVLNTTSGSAPSDEYGWAHGRGCIQLPLADVWAALQRDPARGVQLAFYPERANSRCDGTLGVDPSYPLSFMTKETPNGGIQSQFDFDVTFAGGPTARDGNGVPTEYVLGYRMTRWNSFALHVLQGSVLLRERAPGVTGVELVRHLWARNTNNPSQALLWIGDFYEGLRLEVHGTPVPVTCSLP